VAEQLAASQEGFSSIELVIGIIHLFQIAFKRVNNINKIHPSFEATGEWRYKTWKGCEG
jgi:hypothetical protein